MPRIVRIINRFNLGGPTYNAALLTKYLAPEFETLLVAGTKMDTEESSEFICRDLGIDYVKVPEMEREINLTRDFKAYKKLKAIIGDYKPEIVHTHAAKSGTLGRLAALACNVPVIVHTFHGHVFHSYFSQLKTKVFLKIERYLANRSTAIIAVSEQQKNELSSIHKICPPEKIKVIPLGFDLSRFRENMDQKRNSFRKTYFLEDDEIAIGIIGRLVPVKNQQLFLRAIKYLQDKSVNKVRAFIIGDGEDLQKLRNMAEQMNLDYVYCPEYCKKSFLTFTSWIKNIDVALAGLDIVALTSLNEGTPVSLIEAQAAGKPIVSTRVGGIENVVIENKTALLTEVENEDRFSESLLRIAEDMNLRNAMSVNGWNFVENQFHYRRLVKDMKAFYHDLLINNLQTTH
jgi:glycosyltransferase involved in cell wall biosynthesis